MAVAEEMEVAVGMGEVFMSVHVLVDQVHPQEQVKILQNLPGRTIGDQAVILFHHKGPVSDFLQDGKVVGGGNDGLAKGMEFSKQFHQPDLGPRV